MKMAWEYAAAESRDYITPEDINAAIAAGAERLNLWRELLEALGRRRCEDPSLCAFVAVEKYEGKP